MVDTTWSEIPAALSAWTKGFGIQSFGTSMFGGEEGSGSSLLTEWTETP